MNRDPIGIVLRLLLAGGRFDEGIGAERPAGGFGKEYGGYPAVSNRSPSGTESRTTTSRARTLPSFP